MADRYRAKIDKTELMYKRRYKVKHQKGQPKREAIFNLVTPCSRPDNLIHIYNSILNQKVPINNIIWWIVFDLEKAPFDVIKKFPDVEVRSFVYQEHSFGNAQRNFAIRRIKSGWVYFVDDDNIIHPDFLDTIISINYSGVIVDQVFKNGGRRFAASPGGTRCGAIDTAQFIVQRSMIDVEWILHRYDADGAFIEDIHNRNREKFIYINKPLSYYNYLK
jgi:hypothetical protein